MTKFVSKSFIQDEEHLYSILEELEIPARVYVNKSDNTVYGYEVNLVCHTRFSEWGGERVYNHYSLIIPVDMEVKRIRKSLRNFAAKSQHDAYNTYEV